MATAIERIPFSTKTEAERTEARRIKNELSKIRPELQTILDDDKIAEAKAAGKLVELLTREMLFSAKLVCCQARLKSCVLADYKADHDDRIAKREAAAAALRDVRDAWHAQLKADGVDPVNVSTAFSCGTLTPERVRDAQKALDAAATAVGRMEITRAQLDCEAFPPIPECERWRVSGGYELPGYAENLASVCAELSGTVEAAPSLLKRIGTLVSGLAGGPATLAPQV